VLTRHAAEKEVDRPAAAHMPRVRVPLQLTSRSLDVGEGIQDGPWFSSRRA
jgi:hypothetical protein